MAGLRSKGSLAVALAVGLVAGMVLGLGASSFGASSGRATVTGIGSLAGFRHVVFLSHLNNPHLTPGFPGDPQFSLTTAFTVPKDGYYLQFVQEGEHTGTHWGAPCHFHVGAACAGDLPPQSLVLPAVVIDIRTKTQQNVDYRATIADLKAWIAKYGPMPKNAAVLLRTGCD